MVVFGLLRFFLGGKGVATVPLLFLLYALWSSVFFQVCVYFNLPFFPPESIAEGNKT